MFFNKRPKKKKFVSHGMEIVLTTDFEEMNYEGYTAAYASNDFVVFTLKEPFELLGLDKNASIEQYIDIVVKANLDQHKVMKKVDSEKNCYASAYMNSDDGQTYIYHIYFFKSKDAFWTVQFATNSKNTFMFMDIKEWVKTVKFI